MTMPVGSASSFVMIGNREDLSDEIYRITPTKTPFLSMADREKATNTLHEWQTMDLAANTATNVQLEGDDATLDSPTTTVRLNNYTTISRKVPGVTGTQESIDHAGRDSEMASQVTAKMFELKRDIETILVGANSAKNSGSSTVGPARSGASQRPPPTSIVLKSRYSESQPSGVIAIVPSRSIPPTGANVSRACAGMIVARRDTSNDFVSSRRTPRWNGAANPTVPFVNAGAMTDGAQPTARSIPL